LLEGIYSRFQTPTGSAFLDKIRATKEARIVGGNLFPISNPEPEVHSRIKSGYGRTEYCWREFIPDSEPRTGSAFPDKIRLRKNPCCWRECIPDSEPRAGSVFPDKIRLRKNRVLLEGIYSRFRTRTGSAFPDKIRLRKNRVLLEGIYSRFQTSNPKCIPR
jgi:hypothetical protein